MTAVTKIAPPRAAKRPRVETWHNRVKTDDYAWLRADNWQEVMHDPSVLAPEIRAHLDAENAYHRGRARRYQGAAGDALRRDEGPHQGRRQLGAGARRRLMPITRALSPAASSRASAASRAIFRVPNSSCSTATRCRKARRSSASAASAFRPTKASPPGPSTTRARNSTGCTSAIWRTAAIAPKRSTTRPAMRLGCRRQELLLHVAGRQPPAAQGVPACARHGAGRRSARL